MGLIAEGVETLAHAEQLLALGCPHAQGHLFSEPRTTEATEALLARAFERVALEHPDLAGPEAPLQLPQRTRRTAWSRPFSRISARARASAARSRAGSPR